jgi:hypothetical protein
MKAAGNARTQLPSELLGRWKSFGVAFSGGAIFRGGLRFGGVAIAAGVLRGLRLRAVWWCGGLAGGKLHGRGEVARAGGTLLETGRPPLLTVW